jgi:hypothetical protein
MAVIKSMGVAATLSGLLILQSSVLAQQSQVPPDNQKQDPTITQPASDSKSQSEGPQPDKARAAETALKFRRLVPIVPDLSRGSDGLLTIYGQRAIETRLVTGTNVKEPALDARPLPSGLPVEAAEPVEIPNDQFSPSTLKFNESVPILDPIRTDSWHFEAGAPFLSLEHRDGMQGLRSAAPEASATGPLFGGRLDLFESLEYRLSRATIEGLGGINDTTFQSYDWNTHADIKAGELHTASVRFVLFSQDDAFATLNGLTHLEATPSYLMRGGQLFASDSYKATGGFTLDSSISSKAMHLSVLPQGPDPMILIQQGELEGNYFDRLYRMSRRTEWKESIQLPESASQKHHIRLGGALARDSFDSWRHDNRITLLGSDPAPFGTVDFVGSGREALAAGEFTGWVEDRWTPVRRAEFTLGMRYDWTTQSRTNEWGPRIGFAVAPTSSDRTVIRGGAGIFYDIMPLTIGTFTRSLQRVVTFINDEGDLISPAQTLTNTLAKPNLNTSHVLGWNLELDQQVLSRLFVRVRAEERLGENLPIVTPNPPTLAQSELVLSDRGTSRYRALETTVTFRPRRQSTVNFSYTRSDSRGDLNPLSSILGTFEKAVITPDRYALSRSDAPNRFLVWGDVEAFKGVAVSSALDVHTGFPFAFFDADRHVPNETDFGRLPHTVSLDLGLYRDFRIAVIRPQARLRLGLRVYNLTNHFNPRDANLGENVTETAPLLKGFLNSAGRTYRLSAILSF